MKPQLYSIAAKEGEFHANVIIYPSPCVLQVHREMKPVGLEARGLSLAAAEVLLVLAASRNKASTKQAVKGNPWSFGNPYDKDAEIVWCQWKFIAAWMWCSWMKGGEKSAEQYRHMKALGYPRNHAAFRKMMGRIGFVTAKG